MDTLEQARETARYALEHAARDGHDVSLAADSPVVPDEHFPELTWRGTWSAIGELLVLLRESGARWVNLRFGLEPDGPLLIRYEARPEADPLDDPRVPSVTGGFDCHRLMTHAEFTEHVGRSRT
jgi:hypothetical protein